MKFFQAIRYVLESLYCELIPAPLRPRLQAPKDLENRLESHSRWVAGNTGDQLDLRHRDLRQVDLSTANLTRAILLDCDLRGAVLCPPKGDDQEHSRRESSRLNLKGIDLSYSRLEGAHLALPEDGDGYAPPGMDLSGARLVGVTGLFGNARAYVGRGIRFSPGEEPQLQRWLPSFSWGDFPSWEMMKLLGNLPIFAVSNTIVASILVYSVAADWFNRQVQALLSAPSKGEAASLLSDVLRPLPAPAHLGHLLLAFVGLTLANILFRTRCPTIVQEYSRYSVFGRGHDRGERITYLSAAFSQPLLRYICFILLIWTGSFLISYAYERIIEALYFFFPEGPLSQLSLF